MCFQIWHSSALLTSAVHYLSSSVTQTKCYSYSQRPFNKAPSNVHFISCYEEDMLHLLPLSFDDVLFPKQLDLTPVLVFSVRQSNGFQRYCFQCCYLFERGILGMCVCQQTQLHPCISLQLGMPTFVLLQFQFLGCNSDVETRKKKQNMTYATKMLLLEHFDLVKTSGEPFNIACGSFDFLLN